MSKFKKSTSTPEATRPGTTHIHHHTPSVAGEVGIKLVGAIVVMFISWPIGVFLFDKAGFKNSEQILAQFIVFIILFSVLLFFLNTAIGSKWEQWLEHREKMAEKYIEQIRYQHLMQQAGVMNSRQMGEKARLVKLVIIVMFQAYDEYAKNGAFSGTERLWSRRKAGAITLAGESGPVGEEFAKKVRPFLEANNLIINNQLNLDQFPNYESVQQKLTGPVFLNKPTLPTIQPTDWSIINT